MAGSNWDRVYKMAFASVYPQYVRKAEAKGRTRGEVDEVLRWLTGYSQGPRRGDRAENRRRDLLRGVSGWPCCPTSFDVVMVSLEIPSAAGTAAQCY